MLLSTFGFAKSDGRYTSIHCKKREKKIRSDRCKICKVIQYSICGITMSYMPILIPEETFTIKALALYFFQIVLIQYKSEESFQKEILSLPSAII
jgi:hypothetical protein